MATLILCSSICVRDMILYSDGLLFPSTLLARPCSSRAFMFFSNSSNLVVTCSAVASGANSGSASCHLLVSSLSLTIHLFLALAKVLTPFAFTILYIFCKARFLFPAVMLLLATLMRPATAGPASLCLPFAVLTGLPPTPLCPVR